MKKNSYFYGRIMNTMLKPLRQTLLIIILVLILPTLIFSIYEIGSLRKNEQVIEEIYTNQLDAILFSINQYSSDIVSAWAEKVEDCFRQDELAVDSCIESVLNELSSVSQIILLNSRDSTLTLLAAHEYSTVRLDDIRQLVYRQDSNLQRLQTYFRGGYNKVMPFEGTSYAEQLLVFGLERGGDIDFILMVNNQEKFIQGILDPKIQEIAQNKFNIAAVRNSNDSVIYNSDRQQVPMTIEHERPFWLLSNYSLGIKLSQTTISELSKERSRRNIILIGLIDFVLLLGIWFIYRNLKNQLELSQLKSDFISNVSHEIRTPLALISMYIETLEMGRVRSQEKIIEYYKVIQQETQRLTGIVNKILSFSHIESGKRQYSFEQVTLNHIVKDCYSSYQIRLDKDKFEHTLTLSEPDIQLKADKEAVGEAVSNLIDNAIKYSGERKKIEVSTYEKSGNFIISVQDHGIGISEADQKYVYEKFYRVTEKNLALKAKGSGLGLTIVQHIMDAHQGSIELSSKKGEGSKFSLVFPINKPTSNEKNSDS